jgi:hypothetical protein
VDVRMEGRANKSELKTKQRCVSEVVSAGWRKWLRA